MKKILNKIQMFYPCDECSLSVKLKTAYRVVMVKLLGKYAYPKISLVPYIKKDKSLRSELEFLVRYYVSRIGFEELWAQKPRQSKEEVESFYSEHDKDVWRQIFLSKYDNHKKKFVLMVSEAVQLYSKDPKIKILDYGCGCGIYAHYLKSLGYQDITLADITSSTFQFVKKAFNNDFKYISLDKEKPLAEVYDVILAVDCLAHAFNPYEDFKHLSEHLKPGGLLVIYYETKRGLTHLDRAIEQKDMTFDYINKNYKCLKTEQVYIKNETHL